jgi:nucleotide-binding universal stress UspA family protein
MKLNPQIKMRGLRVRHLKARRPVLARTRRPAIILVPTDFSYAADRALSYAVQLARRQRARIALLHVVAPAVVSDAFLTSIRTDLPQLAELSGEHLARLARRMGIRPKHQTVKTGHAAEEILHFAEEVEADLIVIGSRGHGAFERMLIGTTAERVVRQARCPVLVVPLPAIEKTARA